MAIITKEILLNIQETINDKASELEIARENLQIKCENILGDINRNNIESPGNRAVACLQNVISELETTFNDLNNEYKEKLQAYRKENGYQSEL